ncbi:DUF3247 family protein [Cognatilysobacter lacus]|uniref:DUF3247 family protein n=1 Tax=Cognatilysobacter lacus TaxID=1643323 RepID=A0A5D8YZU1_9GAMM|nr:DUF3247 family protein [Lysobacter lacus]TZF88235.1 DUF3247 family protein [Lysobacter lacus]
MRIAPRVYTDQADIDRLQALISELPNDRHVQLTLDDGREFVGVVSGRPVAMQFFDPDGHEGTNGIVRIEQPAMEQPEQARWVDLFLDQIIAVRPLDRGELGVHAGSGANGSSPSSRAH